MLDAPAMGAHRDDSFGIRIFLNLRRGLAFMRLFADQSVDHQKAIRISRQNAHLEGPGKLGR